MDESKLKFTRDDIENFKKDLDTWFEDYLRDEETGEWKSQLIEVFRAGYGTCFPEELF